MASGLTDRASGHIDMASGNINRLNPISTQSRYAAGFVQDDWRVTRRLTLNLGLRWDMSSGDMEKYNRLAYFDPFAANALGAKAGLGEDVCGASAGDDD